MLNMSDLSDTDRERIGKLFSDLDIDKDGRISVNELSRVIKGSKDESDTKNKTAKKIMTKGDMDRDETLTFQEFLSYIHDTETHLKLAFKEIDQNSDDRIDASEIQSAMKRLGANVSEADAQKLLKRIDKDGSLDIDYKEWRDFLLFSGTSKIDEIFRYWRHASAIDIGENMCVPDDFTEEEKKSGDAWKTLVSGGIAGCISRTVTAPLDRIKLTWQALGSKASEVGLLGTVNKMVKEGGVTALWRGNGVNCLKIAPESAIKFQAYEVYKCWLNESFGSNPDGSLQLHTKFLAGSLAGATSQSIIYPMEVLKTRMCLRKSGQYSSIFDCARKLYHSNGITIFYRGYVPNILGILPYAGVELAMFETFKQSYSKAFLSKDEKSQNIPPPVYVSVIAGALSSLCGQLGTYPLALVRTKLQAQASSEKTGLLKIVKNIVEHEGIPGLFRGLGPNILKVLPAVSVSYACYDQIKAFLQVSK
ncbi:unnamed protein product [Schistosoma bovis]|uniref:EF-hand domain-containing protein n=1 Tax=Schistosoma bovis TaxID=6184 RepID=A0A430QAF7_SCHBO|nr:uncharacterized protein DC041_0000041 [Schistosoma bovis]CAH8540891.1 unnamed protein product [Schistosoma bovis]CAH8544271.1 unnamed protein product [Schistosoma bovis]